MSCFQLFWTSRLEQPPGISQRLINITWFSRRHLKTVGSLLISLRRCSAIGTPWPLRFVSFTIIIILLLLLCYYFLTLLLRYLVTVSSYAKASLLSEFDSQVTLLMYPGHDEPDVHATEAQLSDGTCQHEFGRGWSRSFFGRTGSGHRLADQHDVRQPVQLQRRHGRWTHRSVPGQDVHRKSSDNDCPSVSVRSGVFVFARWKLVCDRHVCQGPSNAPR